MKNKLKFLAAAVFVLWASNLANGQGPMPQPDGKIDAATRTKVIDAIVKEFNDRYVFPEVAKKIELDIRARQRNNEYDGFSSAQAFSEKLTNDLRAVTRDKHIRVNYSARPLPGRRRNGNDDKAEERAFMKRVNYGFEKIEILPGNVGYINLRNFFVPIDGADTVAAAMSFINNTDALIIDLRQNGGGDPAMVSLLCSYFFGNKKVHLNSLYMRATGQTREFWTNPAVPGKKYDKDIYLITSNRTFSGAEEFANNLKVLKRATIVGETTGGGANPGEMVPLAENFNAFIPGGRAINPVTKTNWEGVGVEPDIKVTATLAFYSAQIEALKKIVATSKDDRTTNFLRDRLSYLEREMENAK